MKISRVDSLILLLFLVLSLIASWNSITSGGYFIYRDERAVVSSGSLGEYFFQIYKNTNAPDIDFEKRIPFLWINLILSQELIDKLKFPILAFLTLAISYFVSKKVLEAQGMPETRRSVISAAAAIFYLINPLSAEMFPSSLQMLNYALFPLFFYLLHDGLVKGSQRSVFLSALLGAFMFFMIVHFLLYIMVSLVVLVPLLIARKVPLPHVARGIAIFSAVFILASLFVILPYLAIYQFDQALVGLFPPSLQDLNMFSGSSILPRAMLLDHRSFWWPYVEYDYPLGDLFFIPAFIFAAVLLACALFDRSGWSIAAMAALVLLFFFSKGNTAPFGGIYEFINFTLPMGWLLRVPMKFLFAIPFFLCLLFIAASARLSRFGTLVIGTWLVFSLAFLCVFTWPFFTGDMAGVLEKTDFTTFEAQYSSINAACLPEWPALLDTITADRYFLATDFSTGGYFINRELRAYSANANWDAARAFSVPGFQYLLVFSNKSEGLVNHADEVYVGQDYSLFRLKDTASPITTPASSWLCYCHMDTARSILLNNTANLSSSLLFFPYSTPGFSQAQVDAASYVVMDSSAPIEASAQEGELFWFSPPTINTGPGWAQTGFDVGNGISVNEPDFGKGFVVPSGCRMEENTSGAANISTVFMVEGDGVYDVYLRALQGRKSGMVHVFIDGNPVDYTPVAADGPTRLQWDRVFSGTLSGGPHTIMLEAYCGPNAVNVGLVRPADERGYPDFSSKTVIYRLIGNSDFVSKGATPCQNPDSSSLSYLNATHAAYASIYVMTPGFYNVSYSAIRAGGIMIDGKEVTGGQVYLASGNHTIKVLPETAGKAMLLDHVTLIRPAPPDRPGLLGRASIVNYTRADSSHYTVWVNSTGPYLLSFAREYTPYWEAHVDGRTYLSSPSYYSLTSYAMNETGLHKVELEYTPQRWFYVGIAVGAVGLLVMGLIVFLPRPPSPQPAGATMEPDVSVSKAGFLNPAAIAVSALLFAASAAYIWLLNDLILLTVPAVSVVSFYLRVPRFKSHLAVFFLSSLLLGALLMVAGNSSYGIFGALALVFFATAVLTAIMEYLGWQGKSPAAGSRARQNMPGRQKIFAMGEKAVKRKYGKPVI